MVLVLIIFEVREEPENGGAGSYLGQTCKKHTRVHQHARQSHFLLRQIIGDDEESGEKTDSHTYVVDYGSFDALSYDYTHSEL